MRNYRITSVWGIPIQVNVSLLVFLPILAWLIGSGTQIETYTGIINGLAGTGLDPVALQQGSLPWVIGILAAVGLFVSVAIHELGHSWVALRYGLGVESITLWILGGLASLSQMPREWNREFWIAIAGPITSLLVGAVCYLGVQLLPASTPVATFVLGWLAVTNVVLAVFNMIPAFPMDGGRILRALLARSQPYAQATRTAARIGSGFAVVFAVVGVLSFSPILLLLALFLYGAANGESRTVVLADLLEGVAVDDLATEDGVTVPADATVSDLVTRMFDQRRTEFAVTENGEIVGTVTLAAFRSLSPEERQRTTVGELASRDLPRLASGTTAFDALIELDRQGADAALIDSPAGTRIVSRSDFASALELRRLMGTGSPR
ncbi:MAG: site-2 protease family protein [Haloarculaceae archaeon]